VTNRLAFTIPDELVHALEHLVQRAVADALASHQPRAEGFLDVNGAASFLASTPSAIRSLVKRNAIPHHKAPNGRLLFDRQELEAWVRSG
jgi:hypothetical protein